jgi:DNA polymerase I-like protein with 3'-5' exonuclease and polymerase domains
MLATPENVEWLRALMQTEKKIVCHYAKFELGMLRAMGIDVFSKNDFKVEFHCTHILSKLYNGLLPSHELKWLGRVLLKRNTSDKDEIEEWCKSNTRRFMKEEGRKPNFSDAPIEVVKRRVLWDVKTTLLLFHKLYPEVQRRSPELYQTERELMFVCIDMEDTGVQIDLTRIKLLRAQALVALERIHRDLDELVCPLTIARKKTRKRKGEKYVEHYEEILDHFNPGSSAIELPAAFQKLGIKLLYKTKAKKVKKGPKKGEMTGGGKWSFDEYAMIRYSAPPLAKIIRESGEEGWTAEKFYEELYDALSQHGLRRRDLLPALVLKCRELEKMVGTYYDRLIEDAVDVRREGNREIGIIHCKFNQSEAMTGRFSSSEPNLQNMPRILGPRECFIPRAGTRNWHFDYEQVEMKFFCHFSGDEDMAAAIADDIHLFVATQIYNLTKEQVSKEQRKRGKSINFGILYGASADKIAETLTSKGLYTSKVEANLLVSRYHRRFPSIKRTTRQLKRLLERQGYVGNPFGRRYYMDENEAYKLLNYMCQGTSADLMKNRLVRIWKWLRENNMRSRLLLTVHDEIALEIPRCEEAIVVPAVKEIMEDRTSYFVPITVGVECATHRWSAKTKAEDMGYKWN